MKVLIVYRHYWPEMTPLGAMLKALAENLAARGHRVTVFTAWPRRDGRVDTSLPRREFKGGVRIVRVRVPAYRGLLMGLAGAAAFLAQAFAYAARHRFDLLWTDSLPPIGNGVIGVLSARAAGARYLYHVHSVHPEAAAIIGLLTTPFLLRAFAKIDSWTCRRADAVVVLSEDMMRTIADRGGNGAVAFHVMRNFLLSEQPARAAAGATPRERYRLAFYGSLGRTQDIQRLVDAMALIDPSEGIELEIIGSGGRPPDIGPLADGRHLPHIRTTAATDMQEAQRMLLGADAGVIALRRGVYRIGFPSKLMAYMATGLPVLAVVETDSTLATYLGDNKAGLVSDGDAAAVADAIRRLRDELPATAATRKRLMRLAERDFGRDAACARWAELVETLGTE